MEDVKEEKAMENKRVPEKTIPVFAVLKNGAILKNIFIVNNSPDSSSPELEEEILLVGRHPDCDILLTHPSISRFHLQIRSLPSRQQLFVTDLSSVHGTWVTDQKVEADACVEVKEGDVIRIGGSTRIYRLHWIPLSRAYDTDNPFVSPSTLMEQDEEKRMLEADENLVVAHQSLADTASGDGGDGRLDVTSEGSGSSVPSEEDEDTSISTREVLLPVAPPSVSSPPRDSVDTEKLQSNEDLQTSSKWELDVEEAAAEMPISSCGSSIPQSGNYPEALACSELEVPAEADEWDVRGDDGLLLDVMSEVLESSVLNGEEDPYLAAKETSSLPLPRDSTETEDLQLTDVVQASPELTVNIIEANTENSSSCSSLRKAQIDGIFEDSGCPSFEFAAEAETLNLCQEVCGENECDAKQVMEVYAEPLTEAENQIHVDNGVTKVFRPVTEVSSSPQIEPKLIGDARSHVDSEVAVETNSQNLHKKSNRETRINSSEVSIVSDYLFAGNLEDEENRMHEAEENPVVAHQSLADTASGDDGDGHLDVTSEGSGSSVPSEDEDTYTTTREVLLPVPRPSVSSLPRDSVDTEKLQSSSKLELDVEEAAAEMPINSCGSSIPQSDGYSKALACSELEVPADEWNVREYGGLLLDVMSERIESSVSNGEEDPYLAAKATSSLPLPRDLQLTDVVQASLELTVNIIQANTENSSSRSSLTKAQIDGVFEDSGCASFELAAEAETLSLCPEVCGENECDAKQVMEVYAEPLTEAENQIHVDNGVTEVFRPVLEVSSSPQIEPKLIGDARGHLDSEVAIETDSQNLHTQSNRETRISSTEVSIVSDCLFAGKIEDIQSLCSSWQLLPESELRDPSGILNEVNLAGDENKISAMSRESEQIFDDGRSSCQSEEQKQSGRQSFLLTPNQKSKTEMSFGSGRSEESYSLSETEGEGNTDKENTKLTEQTDDVLSEMDSSRSSSRRLSTSNIWSRRGKADSVLQVWTNKSEGKQKQIGKPKAQLQRKQALSDMPSYLKLEPEIFTPDKENLTPNSHMLKRLHDVGEIKDTKGSSSSKAMRKPFFDIHVEENLMVEQKQDVQCMSSSNSKVAHEPVVQKKKAERTPFQPLLDKSSFQRQSYTDASSTAAARNSISRGVRSSSNLSDCKNKMKWIIVLDTSSLLNKESRKALHLLQGLKGTHMVVPRTVLRELNETRRARCLLFRGTADMASSALDWIEECKVNTKWWIQLQSPSEETKATAPTPPVTPKSNGSAFPFSLDWNTYAPVIDSPTSEDQVLECALLYRNRNVDEKVVLLSQDVTLKVKAMAEGVICETAHEFYESLKNPFSERFMWPESLPRGRTWSHADDTVLTERYDNPKIRFNGGRRGESGATAAKGLKLILLHNSHYGHTR